MGQRLGHIHPWAWRRVLAPGFEVKGRERCPEGHRGGHCIFQGPCWMGLRNLSWEQEVPGRRKGLSHCERASPAEQKRVPEGKAPGRSCKAGEVRQRQVTQRHELSPCLSERCGYTSSAPEAAARTNLHSHLLRVSFPHAISSVISPLCCYTSSMEKGSPPLVWMSMLNFIVRNEADYPLYRQSRDTRTSGKRPAPPAPAGRGAERCSGSTSSSLLIAMGEERAWTHMSSQGHISRQGNARQPTSGLAAPVPQPGQSLPWGTRLLAAPSATALSRSTASSWGCKAD